MFPDDVNPGQFENLLIEIIPENKINFLDCFDNYCASIYQINPDINIPIKSKIFAYLEATGQPLKISEVDFLNEEFWNFEHPYLNPLKFFLETAANVNVV